MSFSKGAKNGKRSNRSRRRKAAPPSNPVEQRLAVAEQELDRAILAAGRPLTGLRTLRRQIQIARSRLLDLDRQVPLIPYSVGYEQKLLEAAYELIDRVHASLGADHYDQR